METHVKIALSSSLPRRVGAHQTTADTRNTQFSAQQVLAIEGWLNTFCTDDTVLSVLFNNQL